MSRMREVWFPSEPTVKVWKASKHRLVGDAHSAQYIEAAPSARWKRVNPFDFYRTPEQQKQTNPEERAPHERFFILADMAREVMPTNEEAKLRHLAMKMFANFYGLLGLHREEFNPPLPPERDSRAMVLVVPDAIFDGGGRLRRIDPSTDGKELLERHLYERDKRIFGEWGEPHRLRQITLEPDLLLLPEELRFQRRAPHFMSSPFVRPIAFAGEEKPRTASYDDVRREHGVRVVFDRRVLAGVSLISTREPVEAWRSELVKFTWGSSPGRLNENLEGVVPRIAAGADGRPASSWSCPSLLKALYLMSYLDITSGARLQRCQAPGCREYFRVGPRSRESLYCPPPPGKKQSKCASRASSQMHRERRRRDSSTN